MSRPCPREQREVEAILTPSPGVVVGRIPVIVATRGLVLAECRRVSVNSGVG
jgi:hypothetical protein